MSYRGRAARRDDNEQAIADALRAVGASVEFVSGAKGAPDLLVGYLGRDFKLEVKHRSSTTGKTVRRTSGGKRPDERGLTEDQQKWWDGWRGAPPAIVRTPEEALAAIGVVPNLDPRMSRFPARGPTSEWIERYAGHWTRTLGVWDLCIDGPPVRGGARWGVENLGGEATRPAASVEAAKVAADTWAAAHQDDAQAIEACTRGREVHRDPKPDSMPARPARSAT